MMDRFENAIESTYDAMSRSAGNVTDYSGAAYLSLTEHKRLRWFVRSYHDILLKKEGIAYQFLEVFSSGLLFSEAHAREINPNNPDTPKQDAKLLVSSVMKDSKKPKNGYPYDHIDSSATNRFQSRHFNAVALAEVEADLLELLQVSITFAVGENREHAIDPVLKLRYEFYRYFCVKTLFSYLVYEKHFDFHGNGVSFFLSYLIEKNETTLFAFIRHKFSRTESKTRNELIRVIGSIYENELDRRLPNAKEWAAFRVGLQANYADKISQSAMEFISLLTKYADALAAVTLSNRQQMSMSCFSTYFGLLINEYPPWIGSFTGSAGRKNIPTWSMPGKKLIEEVSLLEKSINFNSYDNYLRAFGRLSFIDRDATVKGTELQELGAMLIVPFAIDLGKFEKRGFVRAMRRFDIDTGRIYLDLPDDETKEIDVLAMQALVRTIRHEFQENFRTPFFFEPARSL
jgi:hypothetical protein